MGNILNWVSAKSDHRDIQRYIFQFLLRKKFLQAEDLPGLSAQTDFLQDLAMESLDVVELILSLEDRFGINFDQATHIPRLNTVEGLSNFTQELIQVKSQAP